MEVELPTVPSEEQESEKRQRLKRSSAAHNSFPSFVEYKGPLKIVSKLHKAKRRQAHLTDTHLKLYDTKSDKLMEDVDLSFKTVESADLKKFCFTICKNGEVEYHLQSPKPQGKEGLENWVRMIKNNIDAHRMSTGGIQFAAIHNTQYASTVFTEKITVFVGSWNVGNAIPPDNLGPWIPCNKYDIYVIGAQECSYSHTYSNEADWFERITSHIGSGTVIFQRLLLTRKDYYVLAKLSLLEMRLIVMVKSEHRAKISGVSKSTEATGVAHVIGNKGVVGISFLFHETSLCFVSSHFAAHQSKVQARNANYHEVCQELRLGDKRIDVTNQFHHLFWFGDLNYRIDLPREEVLKLIQKKDYDSLYKEDQLRKELEKKSVFLEFQSQQPKFDPTYRYTKKVTDEKGQRIYNDEKQRIPAWCDRILWKSFPNLQLNVLEWNCADAIITSDHSPVYASFAINTIMLSKKDSNPLFVTFSDLKAKDLSAQDVNGLSDPYVVFHSSCFASGGKKFKTAIIYKTLNPVWDDSIKIPTRTSDVEYLDFQHVILRFMDWDQMTKDDSMGQAIVPLKGAFKNAVEFTAPVTLNGKHQGTISGKVFISDK